MGGGLNPVTDEIQYLLLFREFQLSSGLCGIESAELKGKVQASLWTYPLHNWYTGTGCPIKI